MAGVQPVALYTLRVPPGEFMIPAVPEGASMFRITMAAIDPSEEPDISDEEEGKPLRSTLKLVRFLDDDNGYPMGWSDSDEESDEESSDDEANGGPSQKKSKAQKLLERLAAEDAEDEEMDDDGDEVDDQIAAAEAIKRLIKPTKGKGKATEGDWESDDDDSNASIDEDDLEMDKVVICTLDSERHYCQPLDLVISEGERIHFEVAGAYTIHLSGNYVLPIDDRIGGLSDDDDEEDEDYDLSPDEEELALEMLDQEESDELDELDDPRISELASDEEIPTLVTSTKGKDKGKNKRPAEDSDGEDLDALVAKSMKKDEPVVNGEAKKQTKAERKAAKKLKKNDGEAKPAAPTEKKPEAAVNGSEKKTVQFAKNLEQGPTPSAMPPTKKEEPKKAEAKKEEPAKPAANSTSLGVRNVKGVTVDDRKIGSGPAAKKNSKVEMRYIGKLENGKVFDSNKSGKPFGFKLGAGEVIKGWDIGLEGMSAGGERRITIPANLAYGNQSIPGIPKNSKLIFDVKCLSVK